MRTWLALILTLAAAGPAAAFMSSSPLLSDDVERAPIERVLDNLEAGAGDLSPAERARARGRLHLLAYLRRAGLSRSAFDHRDDLQVLRSQQCRSGAIAAERAPAGRPPRDLCGDGGPGAAPDSAEAHLTAALAALSEAIGLEPDNLRTRLALAYALQQNGDLAAARVQLRLCVRQALATPVAGAYPPEDRLTYEEIVRQFTPLAEARDRPDLDRLDRRFRREEMISVTPILVPLGASDAFPALVDASSPVRFDFSGQGRPMRAGWLTGDAAWLVWDPRRENRIAGGFQMFGSVTWVAFWDDGYRPLGALDDNRDGELASDELNGLALWRDLDGDGVSDPGEVTPVADAGVVSLRYDHERIGDGLWISPRGVTFRDGRTRPTYDWTVRGLVSPGA